MCFMNSFDFILCSLRFFAPHPAKASTRRVSVRFAVKVVIAVRRCGAKTEGTLDLVYFLTTW